MQAPETLTAFEQDQVLRAQAAAQGLQYPMSSKKTPEDLARESLMNGLNLNGTSASAGLDPRLDVDGSFSILRIEDIDFYKYNPRKSRNPRYDEIKESIRAQGITNPITVTRRPGEQKYFPYGGGNTRLQIAKELFEEGDSRFANLRVAIRAWHHESDVIAAHMSENVNRGDTTFWDNAQGVVVFKREWESEHKQTIACAELHEQLRLAGVNYGIKMVQNFVFAVEYLAPVGPWLKTDNLNVTIRPQLGSYLELAERLGKTRSVKEQLNKVLQSHALDLEALAKRNLETDPADHVPVELDAQRLVQEASHAIAKGLELSLARMQALAEALQARPRLSARELLELDTNAPKAPAEPVARSATPGGPDTSQPTTTPPVQPPLGPMAGVVAGTAVQPPSVTSTEMPSLPPVADTAATQHAEFAGLIQALDAVVPIGDCCLNAPEMPFGFFMELPEQPVNYEDKTLNDLRVALFWFLAIASGQTQQSVCTAIAQSDLMTATRWGQTLTSGPRPMIASLGQVFNSTMVTIAGSKNRDGQIMGDILLASKAVWLLLTHPQIGPLLTRLIALMQRMQANSPVSYEAGHLQLPSWDESML